MPQREIMTVAKFRELQAQEQKKSKYGNKKVTIDNITFDSLAEARRYEQLKLMEQAGAISDLRLQPRYELQKAFTDSSGIKHRAITYVADFEFRERVSAGVWRWIVEDVKGKAVPVYLIKRKLFLFKYPDLTFREVKA